MLPNKHFQITSLQVKKEKLLIDNFSSRLPCIDIYDNDCTISIKRVFSKIILSDINLGLDSLDNDNLGSFRKEWVLNIFSSALWLGIQGMAAMNIHRNFPQELYVT